METPTYAAIAAFRENAVKGNNDLPVYYLEKKLTTPRRECNCEISECIATGQGNPLVVGV